MTISYFSLCCAFFVCSLVVKLEYSDTEKVLHSILPKLQPEELPDVDDEFGEKKHHYFTNYVQNLYKEISLSDKDKSVHVSNDRTFTDDQKDLASVHILQENNFNQKNLQFDISSLPRNIDVSLAEIVTQQNNADKMSKKIPDVTEDYNIKDVTKDFQVFYSSGTTLFEVGLDKEIRKQANMNAQLVLFKNVNKTQLSSLRLRHRRNVQDFLEEQDLGVITTDSFCSVEPWIVDFSELGWQSWLWAPSSYHANSCSGSCSFLNSNNTISFHAIIKQHYYRYPYFQESSTEHLDLSTYCVPASYEALTITYITKQKMISMRQIPKMKVTSCMCA
ncbi:transforming growth factor beta-2 proprotein-like [Mytilus californianus]|uniref:transforming growth factor beta-2 proprotein-like n=1 Tax=Mytilus californianus TaxID=6549 RepID=UPI0022465476|nr:transforming growth factor beta-2 proprotein-like [Mytilus californianus]